MPTNNCITAVYKTMRVLKAIRGKREVPLGGAGLPLLAGR
jgi:hypothetical protein